MDSGAADLPTGWGVRSQFALFGPSPVSEKTRQCPLLLSLCLQPSWPTSVALQPDDFKHNMTAAKNVQLAGPRVVIEIPTIVAKSVLPQTYPRLEEEYTKRGGIQVPVCDETAREVFIMARTEQPFIGSPTPIGEALEWLKAAIMQAQSEQSPCAHGRD